jgi:hypothetical protein
MNKSTEIKILVEEINKYSGTQRGNEAKMKYDILKLEEERKRNRYAFVNTLLLSFIAIVNLVFVYLKYIEKK